MLWSCMCSLIEILWVLEEKVSLNFWQLPHDVPVTEIFEVNLHVNFLDFLWNWVKLLGIFRWFNLNHLIESCAANYDWPFGTLPFGLFGSNLDTRDLETYPRTYSGHFWNMSIFDDSRAIWVLFRKWVVSENQSFLDEGAIVIPLSVWI